MVPQNILLTSFMNVPWSTQTFDDVHFTRISRVAVGRVMSVGCRKWIIAGASQFAVFLCEEFVLLHLAQLVTVEQLFRISDVLLDRCYERFETVEVLFGPEVADDADLEETAVKIAVEVVQNVSFLRKEKKKIEAPLLTFILTSSPVAMTRRIPSTHHRLVLVLVVRIPAYRHHHLPHLPVVHACPSVINSRLEVLRQLAHHVDSEVRWNYAMCTTCELSVSELNHQKLSQNCFHWKSLRKCWRMSRWLTLRNEATDCRITSQALISSHYLLEFLQSTRESLIKLQEFRDFSTLLPNSLDPRLNPLIIGPQAKCGSPWTALLLLLIVY